MQQSAPDTARVQSLIQAFAESTDSTHPAALAAELQQAFNLTGSLPTDAHGTIDTRVTVLVLPAADVQKLLPQGLELAPQPVVPSGFHPVYILSSHDTFQAWFGDMDYQEMMLAVPYVQISEARGRYPGPYIYMPRLYLNDAVPRVLGVHLYGWEKLTPKQHWLTGIPVAVSGALSGGGGIARFAERSESSPRSEPAPARAAATALLTGRDAGLSSARSRSTSSTRIEGGRSSGRRDRQRAITSARPCGTSATRSLIRGASRAPFWISTSIALRPL